MELLRETESEADAAASMRLVDALKAGACDDDVLSIITPAHAAYRDRRGRMMLHKTSFYNASVAVVQALIIANPSACSSATVTWAGFLCTSLPAPWPLPATSCRPRCAPWPCPRCQRNLPHGPCGATRRGRARRWPRTRAPPAASTSLRAFPALPAAAPGLPARCPRRSCRVWSVFKCFSAVQRSPRLRENGSDRRVGCGADLHLRSAAVGGLAAQISAKCLHITCCARTACQLEHGTLCISRQLAASRVFTSTLWILPPNSCAIA